MDVVEIILTASHFIFELNKACTVLRTPTTFVHITHFYPNSPDTILSEITRPGSGMHFYLPTQHYKPGTVLGRGEWYGVAKLVYGLVLKHKEDF